MSFESHITRLPHAYDPALGAEALEAVPGLSGDLAKLIYGVGGSSPYLKSLIHKEATWLPEALQDADAALAALMAELRAGAPDQRPTALRAAKRRVALLTALADVAGVWSLEKVTGTLTDFADLASQLALEATIGAEIRRKKLPGATEDDIPTAGGMVSIAMGKMGAHELNYSSDIDLICLFDETRFDPDDYHDARASFIRATRKMAAMLNDITGDGYVFRTDLRLRPDPAVTPVCIAMETAERYYESLGRTWERAAYIKARPSAGDLAAGQRFLTTLTPFVWRKHLDFAAIQDAHDMRLRIREHKGLGGALELDGHDMKLGRGGIREIEFFTQTRQLIAGGRDPYLRDRHTVPGLRKLAARGWVPEEVAEGLADHYRFHREVEHRIQMVGDAQTHRLPKGAEGWGRIAGLMGRDVADIQNELRRRIGEVHEMTEGFFAPDAACAADAGEVAPHAFDERILERWQTYPALRSPRAVEIFKRVRPEMLRRLAQTARPDEALLALDGFLRGLPAGVQLFSLFEANPQLIDLLVDIVGTAPALAQHLSRNSGVFDAVIGGSFFTGWPGVNALTEDLTERLARESDYEHQLDGARRWAKEWQFRIGVHHLRGLIGAEEAGRQYADLADAVLAGLWQPVADHFAQKHGPMPGRGAMVLGMGSLGAQRLNATSDLDLIVIYDADGVEASEGRRPLAARPYYARFTQALVTAISAPMAQGRLYEVDMRLRPSGTQGPVATSLPSFKNYQENEAWTWEHLALTRARPVTGAPALMAEVEAFRQEVLKAETGTGTEAGAGTGAACVGADVAEMRGRIAAAKAPDGPWDAKIGAGRLQDIELLSQTAALLAGSPRRTVTQGLQAGVAIGWLSAAESSDLATTYRLCWQVQLASKLLSGQTIDPDSIGEGGRAFLLRETGAQDMEALMAHLQTSCSTAAKLIEDALARCDALPTGEV
ncbi:[protein-PII] uridylyltransferase family protein [Shimia marina]|uniref:Glutamate-ammonia-ligase adenylyltransferase n=1 Tax=Shimia marina TaxID=321267 RepID=A0A0P1FE13_9RHOB|nr:glutamine-synthetase adenylyltransferase [Shimia marina]CUH53016.1 Glutamate-ammonia-ligase adenylyltransferase [Shimia marina]SFD92426.1 glutamate-ammonia-ligase adenylyltransferase [Shimia marina]